MTILEPPVLPNLLYLLLVAGIWLGAAAAITPGTGALEALALLALAGAGVGTLTSPLNAWALVIILVGGGFFLASFRLKRAEVWLALAAVALTVGSAFLFVTGEGHAAVHPAVAVVASLSTIGFFWFTLRKGIAAHRSRPVIDASKVVGQIGEVRTALDPTGSVYAGGELWTARADQRIEEGAQVKIMGKEGLILTVERTSDLPRSESRKGGS